MKYIYSNATVPKDVQLLSQIDCAADRLIGKLIQIDLKKLGISEYNQRYLGSKLVHPVGTFQLYTYLLSLSLAGSKVPLSNFTFVDFGGGSGVLSLLAKELGIGKVIYNDIYDVSCEDIKRLSRRIDINIDGYVCGDIDELLVYVKEQSLSVNAISSYDVIEHIYNIESYLRKLRLISDNPFRVVFGSGANIKNPVIRRILRNIHLNAENRDKEKKWGHKDRDTLRGFLNVRREMIKNYDPKLERDIVEEIAKATRGLMKEDIEKCVVEYKTTGGISYKPDHPTNTCDPYTGNWAEHLMDTGWLESILRDEGFEVAILSGYWKDSKRIYIRLIKNLLNLGIKHIGKAGLFISPYYVVFADYHV